jgi:multiple sugar transport system permease protein
MIIMAGPFIAMISVSLQDDVVLSGADWFSSNLSLKSYKLVLQTSTIPRWFLNSIIVTSVITTVGTFISAMSGYVFAKKKFPGKDVIFMLFISVLMFPSQSWIITLFIEFSKLNLINTYYPFFLSGISSAFGIFLLRQYIIQAVHNDILDASEIDGCGEFAKFIRIVLPMIKPALTTLAILLFIGWWSEFLFSLVVVNTSDMYMISVGVAVLQGVFKSSGGIRASMAAVAIAQIPLLIVYIVFNKNIMKGVAVQLK